MEKHSPTVTNDAHGVVDRLLRDYGYIPGRRKSFIATLYLGSMNCMSLTENFKGLKRVLSL